MYKRQEELEQFFRGCGWTPYFVEGDEPEKMHELMAATLDKVIADIRRIQKNARSKNDTTRPRWPMTVSYTHLDVYKRQVLGRSIQVGIISFHCA